MSWYSLEITLPVKCGKNEVTIYHLWWCDSLLWGLDLRHREATSTKDWLDQG